MEAVLARLVDIDSGSRDAAGVDAVGDVLAAMLEADGIAVVRFPNATYGAALRAEVPGRVGGAPVLLMGHRDTVFPERERRRSARSAATAIRRSGRGSPT